MYAHQLLRWLQILGLALCLVAPAGAASKSEQRAEVRKSTQKVMNQLYRSQPSARKAVEGAAGYAVFSNFGMKLFVAGSGTGQGIAVERASGQETFMRMVEVQAGLGLGIKKFGLVFVFENAQALQHFIQSGREAGAQTSVAATDGKAGMVLQGAISISPGVWLYQVTEKGLAAEATIKGTKYYKNDDLN